MATTNTLPMVNFVREYGWNPVEANLLGASAFFSGDTPVENVLGSIGAFREAHGFAPQKPKFCADRKGKVVPCDSPEAVPYSEREGVTNDPLAQGGSGSGSTTTAPEGYKKKDVWVDANGDAVPPGTPGAQPTDLYSKDAGVGATVKEYLGLDTDDMFKRITLVVFAVVILAVALISLR